MQNSEERINIKNDEFVIEKYVPGIHSLTPRESRTKTKLQEFEIKNAILGNKIEIKNSEDKKYYLVEDGTVIKLEEKNYSFYRLNLETYKWDLDQSLLAIFHDSFLKYQEFLDFKDYYSNSEELDLDKGVKRL